jgi:hypothetical protein
MHEVKAMLVQIMAALFGVLLFAGLAFLFLTCAYELSALSSQLLSSERAKPVLQFVRDALEAE